MTPARPTDLFGVAVAMPREDAERLFRALESAWRSLTDRAPGDLGRDWDLLFNRFYDPIAQGGRLRRELDSLQSAVVDAPYLTEQLVLQVGSGRALITPEGRAVLELLRSELARDGATVSFSDDRRWSVEHELLGRYRNANRRRLTDVLKLRSGDAAPLLPPAAATVLFLLLNRSTSPERAVTRPEDSAARKYVDEAMAGSVLAFANALVPGKRHLEHVSLYSGYPLTEARRRLSDHLSSEPGRLYIKAGSEDEVLRFVAHDLAKRRLPESKLTVAFDSMVDAYRASASALAAYGIGFGRPADVKRLRDQLMAFYREACDGC